MGRIFRTGDIVKHFEHDLFNRKDTLFLYEIIGVASYKDGRSQKLAYIIRELFDTDEFSNTDCKIVEYDDFHQKVNKSEYPKSEQEYVYEKVDREVYEKMERGCYSDFILLLEGRF